MTEGPMLLPSGGIEVYKQPSMLAHRPRKPAILGRNKQFSSGSGHPMQQSDPDQPYKSEAGKRQYEAWRERTAEAAYKKAQGQRNGYGPGSQSEHAMGTIDDDEVPF